MGRRQDREKKRNKFEHAKGDPATRKTQERQAKRRKRKFWRDL